MGWAVGDYKVWMDATGLFVFKAYILKIFFVPLKNERMQSEDFCLSRIIGND